MNTKQTSKSSIRLLKQPTDNDTKQKSFWRWFYINNQNSSSVRTDEMKHNRGRAQDLRQKFYVIKTSSEQ